MEGRGTPAAAGAVAKRVHDLGIRLDYLDMDEPLTWGRWAPRNKCPETIEKLAQTAATKVAVYRAQFPNMRVNLIDAVGGSYKTEVQEEVMFIDLLGKLGVHVDFFIADVQWGANKWRSNSSAPPCSRMQHLHASQAPTCRDLLLLGHRPPDRPRRRP